MGIFHTSQIFNPSRPIEFGHSRQQFVFTLVKVSNLKLLRQKLHEGKISLNSSKQWVGRCTKKDRYKCPLVNKQFAIENGHRNSGFSPKKCWFSIVTLVYQTVPPVSSWNTDPCPPEIHGVSPWWWITPMNTPSLGWTAIYQLCVASPGYIHAHLYIYIYLNVYI